MKFQTLKTILFFAFFLAQFQVYSQCEVEVRLYQDDMPTDGEWAVGAEPAVGTAAIQVFLFEVDPAYNESDPDLNIPPSAIITMVLDEGAYKATIPAGSCDKNFVVAVQDSGEPTFTLANSGIFDYIATTGDNDNDFVGRKDIYVEVAPGNLIPFQTNASVSGLVTFAPPFVASPSEVEVTYPINSTDNEIYFADLDLSGAVTYSIDGGGLTGANGSSWTLDPAGYIIYDGGSVAGSGVDMITIIADNGTYTDTTFVTVNLTEEPNTITPMAVEATYPVNSTGNEIYFADLDLSGAVTYSIDGGGMTGANGSSWTLDPAGYITYDGGSVDGNGVDMITIVADNGTDTDTTFVTINLTNDPNTITPTTVEATYSVNSTDNEIHFASLDLSGAVTYSIDGGGMTGANGSNWTLDPAGYITYDGGSVAGDDIDMLTIVADNGTDTDTTYIVVNLIEEPNTITPTTVETTYSVNSTDNEIYFAGLDLSGAVTYSIDGGGLTGANGSSWTLDPAGYITYTGGSISGSDIDMITIVADNGTDTDTTFLVINLIEEAVAPTSITVFGGGNSTGSLPVEFMFFGATNTEGCSVNLEWATATETENEGFFIEKSRDGRNFDEIAWIEGAGNSSQTINYNFVDKNSSRVNYYRLKQVDYDGTYEYSKTIIVSDGCGSINNEVSLFPSPARNFVNVQSSLGFVGNVTITVSDHSGKIHLSEIISDARVNEKLDISNLVGGMYFVKITDESNEIYPTQKFIKH